MDKNRGGSAFPHQWEDGTFTSGISKRDWFAGQALIGLAQGDSFPRDIAKRAYEIADAMMQERSE